LRSINAHLEIRGPIEREVFTRRGGKTANREGIEGISGYGGIGRVDCRKLTEIE